MLLCRVKYFYQENKKQKKRREYAVATEKKCSDNNIGAKMIRSAL